MFLASIVIQSGHPFSPVGKRTLRLSTWPHILAPVKEEVLMPHGKKKKSRRKKRGKRTSIAPTSNSKSKMVRIGVSLLVILVALILWSIFMTESPTP